MICRYLYKRLLRPQLVSLPQETKVFCSMAAAMVFQFSQHDYTYSLIPTRILCEIFQDGWLQSNKTHFDTHHRTGAWTRYHVEWNSTAKGGTGERLDVHPAPPWVFSQSRPLSWRSLQYKNAVNDFKTCTPACPGGLPEGRHLVTCISVRWH